MKSSLNYTFQVVSPQYGEFTVKAPERFRKEIEQHVWHVKFSPGRTPGRQFSVATNVRRPGECQYPLQLHALVWRLMGRPPVRALDHVDGQPLNNSEDNLRDGTRGNSQNVKALRADNSSGFKGVYWKASSGKWGAYIRVNKKAVHLGYFTTPLAAAGAYDRACVVHHGQFAVPNGVPA